MHAARNIVAETHGEFGDVAGALAEAAVSYEDTFTTQRVQHAALETHGGLAWVDAGGILNIRSSTQVPFLTRRALAQVFDLPPDRIRVFCERVGGGFGGKQEMLVEDILALAALKTGRPVKLEFTREEQFVATSTRHPMRITVKAGADKDGKLTALQLDVLSNTGAYGNHAGPVLFHAVAESLGVYNCPNKKVDAVAAYTNTVPSGAFRGYGLPQIADCGRGCDRRACKTARHRPVRLPPPQRGQAGRSHAVAAADRISRRALRQLRPRPVPRSGRARDGAEDAPKPALSADWLVGDGIALTMIDTVPPAGHLADSQHRAARRRRFRADGRHRRVRQRHHDRASPDRRDRAGDDGRSYRR